MQIACEWGLSGINAWRSRASAFVIVDVLSFSTAVSVAIDRGAEIIPFPFGDDAAAVEEAAKQGAIAASPRRARGGQISLSPESFATLNAGSTVLLPSPNGSRLSLATGDVPTFCASFRNADAMARAAAMFEGVLVVIAAGERWPDQSLRPAVEDWLGAGAVIAAMQGQPTAEAMLARSAFLSNRTDLARLVSASVSGRELIDRGFERDVEIALQVGVSPKAAVLRNGRYVAHGTAA